MDEAGRGRIDHGPSARTQPVRRRPEPGPQPVRQRRYDLTDTPSNAGTRTAHRAVTGTSDRKDPSPAPARPTEPRAPPLQQPRYGPTGPATPTPITTFAYNSSEYTDRVSSPARVNASTADGS